MKFPKSIKLGHFNIIIKLIDSDIAAVGNEEGSFHSGIKTIFIDKAIAEKGGVDFTCVLIHELLHCSYFKNNLNQNSSEEDIVNSMSNDLTELLSRTELLNLINKNIKGKNV